MGRKARKKKQQTRWVTTALKRPLAEEIQREIIDKGVGGYSSLTGFVEEASRRRLEELKVLAASRQEEKK